MEACRSNPSEKPMQQTLLQSIIQLSPSTIEPFKQLKWKGKYIKYSNMVILKKKNFQSIYTFGYQSFKESYE